MPSPGVGNGSEDSRGAQGPASGPHGENTGPTLHRTCPECGSKVPAEKRRCPECGASFVVARQDRRAAEEAASGGFAPERAALNKGAAGGILLIARQPDPGLSTS